MAESTPATTPAIRPRTPGAFIDVYPDIPVTSYDGSIWFDREVLRPLLNTPEAVHQMVHAQIANTPAYGMPYNGREPVLNAYNYIAQSSLLGDWRGPQLYLAVQARLLERFHDKDDELRALVKEKFGKPISRTLMSPNQALSLLDIDTPPANATPAQQYDHILRHLGFDQPQLQEFEAVARRYMDGRRPNWMVMRTYLADYEGHIADPADTKQRTMEEKLQHGLELLSVRYGDELVKIAASLEKVDKTALDQRILATVQEKLTEHQDAFYPNLVRANRFEMTLVAGENLMPLYPWAQGNRDVSTQTTPMPARGIAMFDSQTLFVGTGPINPDGTFDQRRFSRTLMEESFHCADVSTPIKLKGGYTAHPSQLINRSRIHEWREAIPARAEKLNQWIGKLSDAQVKNLSDALDHHLQLEGKATKEELERGWLYDEAQPAAPLSDRARLAKKIMWDAENIIDLPRGYAYNSAAARNAETLVRYHRAHHMAVNYPETEGIDYRKALAITMPELSALYNYVIAPSMAVAEKKSQALNKGRSFFAGLKDRFAEARFQFEVNRHGGLAQLAGYDSMSELTEAVSQTQAEELAEKQSAAPSKKHPKSAPGKDEAVDNGLGMAQQGLVLADAPAQAETSPNYTGKLEARRAAATMEEPGAVVSTGRR